jgi:hypothetical protein
MDRFAIVDMDNTAREDDDVDRAGFEIHFGDVRDINTNTVVYAALAGTLQRDFALFAAQRHTIETTLSVLCKIKKDAAPTTSRIEDLLAWSNAQQLANMLEFPLLCRL